MVKKSANPWLRGLMRAGKQQQRTVARALKVILATPPAKPKKTKGAPATKAARLLKPASLAPRPPAAARV